MSFRSLEDFHRASWKHGFLGWKCHKGQYKIYKTLRDPKFADQKELLILCARRFGKSTLGVILALEDCIRNPGSQVRIIGPTINQTISIILPIIQKVTADAPLGLVRRSKSEKLWNIGESQLLVGGFDAKNIESHRGQESISMYLEESGAADPSDYTYAIVEVLTPQLLHTQGRKVHLTTPPLFMDHPIVTEVVPNTKKNNVFFKFTIFDNPMLKKEQIEDAVRESGGEDTPAFRRNYLCEVVKDEESLIAGQFSEEEHVFRGKPLYYEGQSLSVVGDWGGIQDKTVILICSKHKGILFIHKEFAYEANCESRTVFFDLARFEKTSGALLRQQPYVIDGPASLLMDFYNHYQIVINSPLRKRFEDAVSLLRQKLYESSIRIHESCSLLIETLKYGALNNKKNDFVRHTKYGHCDAIAALCYATWTVNETDITRERHDFQKSIQLLIDQRKKSYTVEDKLHKSLEEKREKYKQDALFNEFEKITRKKPTHSQGFF